MGYSSVGVTAMSDEYRIVPNGNAFIVIDPWGERLVDVFPTEEAAKGHRTLSTRRRHVRNGEATGGHRNRSARAKVWN
jgi:hypothetical protein